MTDKLINPHDAFFKQYLSHLPVAADFLAQHLPAPIVALLDLSQLRLEKDTFIDEALRSHFSDLLFRVPSVDGSLASVYLLIDHKSYPDNWVGLQLFRYIDQALQKEFQERGQLSPIVPLVVYHGNRAWTGQTRFARLFDGMKKPDDKLSLQLGRFVPDFEYHLVNLAALDDDKIRGAVMTRLFILVLKHIFEEGLGGRLDEIVKMVAKVLEQPSGLQMVQALLRYIARAGINVQKEEVAQKLLEVLPQGGGILMQTMAEAWLKEGEEIGIRKGEEIGIRKGEEIGIHKGKVQERAEVVLRILQRRFQPNEDFMLSLRQQLMQINDEAILSKVVDLSLDVLLLPDFTTRLYTLSAPSTNQQTGR